MLRKIESLREGGLKLRQIARRLNEAQIPARRDGRWRAQRISVVLQRSGLHIVRPTKKPGPRIPLHDDHDASIRRAMELRAQGLGLNQIGQRLRKETLGLHCLRFLTRGKQHRLSPRGTCYTQKMRRILPLPLPRFACFAAHLLAVLSLSCGNSDSQEQNSRTWPLLTPFPRTPIHHIAIDGKFDDWEIIPAHWDPVGNTHDTDHDKKDDVPTYVEHEDADLVQYKFTHDAENLYAYFRAVGRIGRTQAATAGKAGRYYVIVTIDVDDDETTGYWLHEGGYYPTSRGYDMNMEFEFYDGHPNKGNYLNHGCLDEMELQAAFLDQAAGIVDVKAGTYKFYTEWVMFNAPSGLPMEKVLPDGSSIVFVKDKSPAYDGIVRLALSPDGHEAEMAAPMRGFMKDRKGRPIVALGKKINLSFSLEASDELAPSKEWASNTAAPIRGYYLSAK